MRSRGRRSMPGPGHLVREHYALLMELTFTAANRSLACLEPSCGAGGRKNQVMLPIVSVKMRKYTCPQSYYSERFIDDIKEGACSLKSVTY